MSDSGFDLQAAWLRRFTADAASNLGAFALRLKEAMPDRVLLQESRGFFSRSGTITGLSVDLGENRYQLELKNGRLNASIAMVVRGITLNTKQLDPADWFARLTDETRQASALAQSLSASLQKFMES